MTDDNSNNSNFKYSEPVKFDKGKPRMDLIAPEIMVELGKILEFGARKYDPRNWERGIDWGRYFAALQRHLWAWWNGEENDLETGESHLSHAACCLMFLLASSKRKIGKDTRYKKEEYLDLEAMKKIDEIMKQQEKNKHKKKKKRK